MLLYIMLYIILYILYIMYYICHIYICVCVLMQDPVASGVEFTVMSVEGF